MGLELPLELLLLDFDLDDFFLEEDDLEERVDLSFSDAEEADDSCRLVDFLSEPFPSSLLKDLLNPNLTILQSVIVQSLLSRSVVGGWLYLFLELLVLVMVMVLSTSDCCGNLLCCTQEITR